MLLTLLPYRHRNAFNRYYHLLFHFSRNNPQSSPRQNPILRQWTVFWFGRQETALSFRVCTNEPTYIVVVLLKTETCGERSICPGISRGGDIELTLAWLGTWHAARLLACDPESLAREPDKRWGPGPGHSVVRAVCMWLYTLCLRNAILKCFAYS